MRNIWSKMLTSVEQRPTLITAGYTAGTGVNGLRKSKTPQSHCCSTKPPVPVSNAQRPNETDRS